MSKHFTLLNINHMHYKYLQRILSILALIVLITSTSFATSTTVTNGDDSGAESLRAAIMDSTNADTVFFDHAVDTITLSGQITISRDVVIIGNGGQSTFIDGNDMTRHFFIGSTGNSIKAEIHHLTLTRGFVNEFGGSIYIDTNQELTLKGVTVSDNSVDEDQRGGAIYLIGTLRLEDCILTDNYSPFTAGAISSIVPSAGMSSDAKLFIDHSIISGNYSSQGGGGIVAFCDTVSIVNSLITGNEANSGGGLYFGSRPGADPANVFIANSTVAGNRCIQNGTASGRGAGIFIWNNTNLHMINTIVGNNTLDNDGDFGTDIYFEGTGTFHDLGSNLISDTSNINTSYNNISLVDIDPKFVSDIIISSVPTTSGDFRLSCGSPAIDMGKDTLDLTTGVDVAGLPRVVNGTIDIGAHERQNFIPVVTNSNDDGPGSLRDLVLLSCPGDTITFDPSTNGDTILLTSGEIELRSGLTLIGNDSTHTIIDGNHSSRIFYMTDADSVRMEHLTIQNGSEVNNSGGGIRKDLGYLSCFAVHISNNSVCCLGGGIYNGSGDIHIENSTIQNNTGNNGGGIYTRFGDVHLENSTIQNNAGSIGGGITNESGNVLLTQSTIQNNTGDIGGGIYTGFGDVLIENSSIINNTSNGDGGGIYNDQGDVQIEYSSIITNSSTDGSGGGIYNVGNLNILKTKVVKNSAENVSLGGGVANLGNADIRESQFLLNRASNGGGLFNMDSMTITNTIIAANFADKGGGIFNDFQGGRRGGNIDVAYLSCTNCTISGNNASVRGSGISDEQEEVILNNTIVANNIGDDISGLIDEGSNNLIGTDPHFVRDASPVDAQGNGGDPGDHRLWCTSPAIDAGTPNTTGLNIGMVDVLDLPRIVNGQIDIGAHEYFAGQLGDLVLDGTHPIMELERATTITAQVGVVEDSTLFQVEETAILESTFEVGDGMLFEVQIAVCPD